MKKGTNDDNNRDIIVPLPTQNDITTAFLIVNRILLRRTFETLSQRKGSKYFKNIMIKDIPWGKVTPIPINFPDAFRQKHPFDFVAEFTSLGCNILKCYKHDYEKPCRGGSPYIINGGFGVCSEACYKIFDEFNDFISETFKIKIDNDENDELSFETFSIENPFKDGSGVENIYCATQLVHLKRFALLPSSRWDERYESKSHSPSSTYLTRDRYFDIYKNNPTKICDMAGLIDSPPLHWDTEMQNVKFNREYCERFRKIYIKETDSCQKQFHRKALGFLFGDSVVNQFSDNDLLSSTMIPISHFMDSLSKVPVNPGYTEKSISQKKYEKGFFVSRPDKTIRRNEKLDIIKPQQQQQIYSIDILGYYKDVISIPVCRDIGRAILILLMAMGEEAVIEHGITSSPGMLRFLLKYYSKSFVKSMGSLTRSTKGLIKCGIRIIAIVMRAVISDVWIKLSIKCLMALKSVFSVVGNIGLLTLVPDILLSVYNVGGYNNEINRENLDKFREENIKEKMMKMKFDDDSGNIPPSFVSPISFISIVDREENNNNDKEKMKKKNKFLSPLITPEYIYNQCLANFHSKFPNEVNKMGRTGIDPEKEIALVEEYLLSLKVNSIGQLLYNFNENNDTNTKLSVTKTVHNIIQSEPTAKREEERESFFDALQTLDNCSEIIQRHVDYHCSELNNIDTKSTRVKYKMIGENYDLTILIFVILLAIIVSYIAYHFICGYCQYYYRNNGNKLIGGAICVSFICSLWVWYLYFGKTIEKEKK